MKKITIPLPDKTQQTGLKLTQLAVQHLNNHGLHQQAQHLSKRVTGETSPEKVIKLTNKYINWKEERIY